MKVVLLAGGFGTRINEESHLKPKPMIEIGGKPILWHIMKYYSQFGHNEFIICAGYKQHVIKEFFSNYFLHMSDITFDMTDNSLVIHNNNAEPWKVTVVDTGLNTMTGGRIKRIQKYINNETFLMTYGDGVSDVPLDELVEFHNKNKKTITMTAVQPGGRFGMLDIDDNDCKIQSFTEKRKEDGGWINGGYMVMEPEIFDLIENDSTTLEREPLETCASNGQLLAFKHDGFWQCMDTLRDKEQLEKLINKGDAPWIKW